MNTPNADYVLIDAVSLVVEADADRLWTPSALARKVHASTSETAAALRWMEANSYVMGVGNGAWRKYRARRFGEYAAAQIDGSGARDA